MTDVLGAQTPVEPEDESSVEEVNEEGQEAETSEDTSEPTFDLQNLDRSYFSPDEMEQAAEAIAEVQTNVPENKIELNYKLDETDQPPEGFGIAIIPVSQRIDGSTQVISVCIAAVPDPRLVAEEEDGADFVNNLVVDHFCTKVASAARPRASGGVGTKPRTIRDFITSMKRDSGLKSYNAFAADFVSALKKYGFGTTLDRNVLRSCLASKAYATAQYPSVPDEMWLKVLSSMRARAETDKLDVQIFSHWENTRANAELDQPSEEMLAKAFEAL